MIDTITIEAIRRSGGVQVRLAGTAIRPRRLPDEDGRVRVALVAAQALLLAGDQVSLDVRVGHGVELELVEVGGTVAYDMRGASARWQVNAEVEGRLIWNAQPFVVATGSDVRRGTRVDVAEGGSAVLREILVLGRTGEVGGRCVTDMDITVAGVPLLVERLTVDTDSRSNPSLLGGARCLDTIVTAGVRSDAPDAWQFDGPGSLERRLTGELHRGDLGLRFAELTATATVVGL